MAFAEDLALFFDSDEFGQVATLGGVEVRGIFDDAYEVVPVGVGVASSQTAFTLATANVPADWDGMEFENDVGSFIVREHHPDGTGVSVLMLEKVGG